MWEMRQAESGSARLRRDEKRRQEFASKRRYLPSRTNLFGLRVSVDVAHECCMMLQDLEGIGIR